MLKIKEIQAVLADQLRPVKHFLERKDITELMINPGGHVYVEAKGVITCCVPAVRALINSSTGSHVSSPKRALRSRLP